MTRIESMEQFRSLPVGAKTQRRSSIYEKKAENHWVNVTNPNHRLVDGLFGGAIRAGLDLVEAPTPAFTVDQRVVVTGDTGGNPAGEHGVANGTEVTVAEPIDPGYPGTVKVEGPGGYHLWIMAGDLAPVEEPELVEIEQATPQAGEFWMDSDRDLNYIVEVREGAADTTYFTGAGTYLGLIPGRRTEVFREKVGRPDWWDDRTADLSRVAVRERRRSDDVARSSVPKEALTDFISSNPTARVTELVERFGLEKPMRSATLTVTARGVITRPVQADDLPGAFSADAGVVFHIPWTRTFTFTRSMPVGECDHGNPEVDVLDQLNSEGVLAENVTISGAFCDNCAF